MRQQQVKICRSILNYDKWESVYRDINITVRMKVSQSTLGIGGIDGRKMYMTGKKVKSLRRGGV